MSRTLSNQFHFLFLFHYFIGTLKHSKLMSPVKNVNQRDGNCMLLIFLVPSGTCELFLCDNGI